MSASVLPFDPNLVRRFRGAGESIAWHVAASVDPARRARIAHLHEEEARVEEQDRGSESLFRADAGPVGALVILLEIDRRGEIPRLSSVVAGSDPAFPQGAISARWPRESPGADGATDLPLSDLVALARYALA